MKFSLTPKERKFSILFQQGTENLVKMAREIRELAYKWESVEQRVSTLSDMERDGDAITHNIHSLLQRSFITPFDREDIGALAGAIDDIADHIHAAADTMLLYKIKQPTGKVKELLDVTQQIAVEVEKAVNEINNKIDQGKLLKQCVEINRLENVGDDIYRAALAELFGDSEDIVNIVKWREIYEDIESAIDGCEDVADILEDIAIKYA